MHIPDALLAPGVSAATSAAAVVGLGVGLRKLRDRLGDRATVLSGIMSAFVFAAQMVKFPVGPGVSGHLLGGVLSAVLLGPWAGAVVIAAVLIVQCLLFGDGGVTALGANFLNMGLIGAVGGYAIYAPLRRAIGGRTGVLLGAMIASWFSVLLGAGAFALELGASGRRADFFPILSWMALVHAAIGVGEAVITGLVVRFVLLTRPDLIYEPEGAASSLGARWGQVAAAGLAVALAVAVFLAPFASETPDGLEYVGARFGFLREDQPSAVPRVIAEHQIAEYQLPVLGKDRVKVATAAAGVVGTLAVFAIGLGFARIFSRRGRGLELEGVAPDAA